MVSQLCKGGACGDAFVSRVEKVLERCLQRSQHDGKVLCPCFLQLSRGK